MNLASYEACLLQKEDDLSNEKSLLGLCQRLTDDAHCSGRWLRKLAFPALKEAVKLNKHCLELKEFIHLISNNIIAPTKPTKIVLPLTPS